MACRCLSRDQETKRRDRMSNKISAGQAGVIAFILVLSNKILLLPSLLYQSVSADGLFVMLGLFLFDFATLFVFVRMKKAYPNDKLVDILSKKLTPFFSKFIYIILLTFFFFKVVLTFSIAYLYFQQQVYQDEFISIAFICAFPLACFGVIKGLRPLARTIELFYYILITGIVVCLSFSLFTTLHSPIFFTSNIKEIGLTMYKHVFTFGDFIFLFLVMDKIEMQGKTSKKIYWNALIGIFLVLALYTIFYCKYHITAFMHNNALSDVVVFTVEFNAFGRLDVIAMVTICFITIFQVNLFSYAVCDSLQVIFPKMTNKFSCGVFIVAYLLLYELYLGKYDVLVQWVNGWEAVLGVVANYVLPIIFLILTVAGRKNEKQTQKST